MKKVSVVREVLTKDDIVTAIAEDLDQSKASVERVLDKLSALGKGALKRGGAGEFTVPGLAKIKTVRLKAARKRAYRHPGSGETCFRSAKPPRKAVKIQPLKQLSDMVRR